MKHLLLKSKSTLNVWLVLLITLMGSATMFTACSDDDDAAQNLSNTWMKTTSDVVGLETGVRTPVTLVFKDAVAGNLEYTCTSSDEAVAMASLSKDNKTVTIEGLAAGTAEIKVAYAASALDNLTATIAVTVSKPAGNPEAEYEGQWMKAANEKTEVNIDEEVAIELTFSDDALKGLEYECKSFDEAVAVTSGISTGADNKKIITVKGVKVGTTKVKIQYWKALEGAGRRLIRCLSDTIEVAVSDRLAGQTMTLANEEMKLKPTEEMQIAMIFGADVDIAATDYVCTPSAENIATAEVKAIDGKLALMVKAKADGETDIKVEYSKNGRKNETLSGNVKIKVMSNLTRILAIGNSYSQDAVEQYLYNLAKAAGHDVVIGNMHIGGCDLETHWANIQSDAADYTYRKIIDGNKTEFANRKLSQTLNEEKWDYISLQQKSGKSVDYATYTSYLPNLITSLQQTNPAAKLMWHQTWAYASNYGSFPSTITEPKQENMYNAIIAAARQAMTDNQALKILIPSGTAIQNGRTSYLGDAFNRDGTHLNVDYGRYTAACTWFEAIFGENVVNNAYKPEAVNDDQAKIARNSAHAAVQKPDNTTSMVRYNPPAKFETPIYVDFGSSTNIAPAPWNNVKAAAEPVALMAGDDYSGVYMKLSDNFKPYQGAGSDENAKGVMTIEGIDFPVSVWADLMSVTGLNVVGDITLYPLDPEKKYDLMILTVRYNGSKGGRIPTFQAIGKITSEEIQKKPGMGKSSDTFEAEKALGFVDKYVKFDNVQPAEDGTIIIRMKDTKNVAEGAPISALIISPVID